MNEATWWKHRIGIFFTKMIHHNFKSVILISSQDKNQLVILSLLFEALSIFFYIQESTKWTTLVSNH